MLPLFFLAFVTLIAVMDASAVQVQGNLELSNKARRLAMDSAAFSGAAAGSAADGLWIDLMKTENFTFPFSMVPVPGLALTERARVYPWIGYQKGSDDASDSDSDDEMVFVTENESVYHTHEDCTHLELTIIATTPDEVKHMRNDYGSRYRPCDNFPRGYTGMIYVSAKGDRYYPSTDYGSLTRHVSLIKKSETTALKLCERCAARDAKAGVGT